MATDPSNARRFLESLRRYDLSKLLDGAVIQLDYDDFFDLCVTIQTANPFGDAITALPDFDRKRLAEAILSDRPGERASADRLRVVATQRPRDDAATLLPELIIHREMMISVATGSTRIQDVNDHYVARHERLSDLCKAANVEYQNPHSDLWAWYRFYKEHHDSYAKRRAYIRALFQPSIESVASKSPHSPPLREPTGWERVDRTLGKARAILASATTEEEFQSVGLMCREVMISLGQAVYDPTKHFSEDGVEPSHTDANRMLEGFLRHAFPGESYKEVRTHVRAALALALNLQHRRTATRQLAALCLEAASSTTSVIAILSSRDA